MHLKRVYKPVLKDSIQKYLPGCFAAFATFAPIPKCSITPQMTKNSILWQKHIQDAPRVPVNVFFLLFLFNLTDFGHVSEQWPTRRRSAPWRNHNKFPDLIQCYDIVECDPLCSFLRRPLRSHFHDSFAKQKQYFKISDKVHWRFANVSFELCDAHAVIYVWIYLMRIGVKNQLMVASLFERPAMFEKYSCLHHQFL